MRLRPRRARTAFLLVAALACAAPLAHAEPRRPSTRSGITEWSSGRPLPRLAGRPVADVALPAWAEAAVERDSSTGVWHTVTRALLHEVAIEYADDGECVIVTRRVLRAGADGYGMPLLARYEPGTSRVEDVTVWIVADAKVYRFGWGFMSDFPLSRDSLHVNGRLVGCDVTLTPGAICATETVVRARRAFDDFWFSDPHL